MSINCICEHLFVWKMQQTKNFPSRHRSLLLLELVNPTKIMHCIILLTANCLFSASEIQDFKSFYVFNLKLKNRKCDTHLNYSEKTYRTFCMILWITNISFQLPLNLKGVETRSIQIRAFLDYIMLFFFMKHCYNFLLCGIFF